MKEYSKVLTDLNSELDLPLVKLLIASDNKLLAEIKNVRRAIAQNTNHVCTSLPQENLCKKLLIAIQKKKDIIETKKTKNEQIIKTIIGKDFFDSIQFYLNEINRIAPDQATALIDILRQ